MDLDRTTPDITRTELGKEIVDVMAHGCMQYMLDHDIPFTENGFERLVQVSQETGVNGRIAFQMYPWTQARFQKAFASRVDVPTQPVNEKRLARLRNRPSIRSRLLAHGLGPDDESISDEVKRRCLERIREYVGAELADVIEALRYGDCQRDLVWSRIEEICSGGDVAETLQRYIAASQ